MAVEVMIQNGNKIYCPVVKSGLEWITERKGTPGKVTFDVIKDVVPASDGGKPVSVTVDGTETSAQYEALNFQEGNPVGLSVGGKKVFHGYVFTKKRNKDGTIKVTAYDQLRYFKNKDTVVYEGKKGSELIQMLAADYHLQCGEIEDTGFVIESGVEENTTLFDIVGNALDETLTATKKVFVLYDDCGRLTLKNVQSLKLDLLIDEETGENFDYTSTIDEGVYNKIKLTYDNDKTGKREVYVAQDGANQNLWGVLQYFEKVQNPIGAKERADAMLQLYNRKARKLTIQKAFGDPRVRAGTSVVVKLNLGDVIVENFMVVEKAKHTFNGDEHWMDLTLIGGDFVA